MKAYWIKCDIDGNGRSWRLAVERDGTVYFVEEDFAEEMTTGCALGQLKLFE